MTVRTEDLPSLLKTAETLQVTGLGSSDFSSKFNLSSPILFLGDKLNTNLQDVENNSSQSSDEIIGSMDNEITFFKEVLKLLCILTNQR